ncbi:MAG: hypothetical protein SPK96_01290, partial [Bacteroidaceae bacterium]|nr:hypothetical protein [Bacteroidaceae bacterium]
SIQRNHPFSDERLFLFELIDTFEKSQKQPKPLSRQIANPIVNKSIFFLFYKLYINVVIFMYRNGRAKQVRKFVNHCV